MKTKRILITYLNNGNLQSQVAKEYLFNKVLKDMIGEGREVKHSILESASKEIVFTDGSKLYVRPISMAKGFRCTHIYVDNAIKSLPNGEELYEAIKPCVIRGDCENFDTSGKQFSFFSFEDGKLNIN